MSEEVGRLQSELQIKAMEINMLENELKTITQKFVNVKKAEEIIAECQWMKKDIETKQAKIYFYDKLLEAIRDNPIFQKDWINLMTMLKLTLDEEQIAELSGR